MSFLEQHALVHGRRGLIRARVYVDLGVCSLGFDRLYRLRCMIEFERLGMRIINRCVVNQLGASVAICREGPGDLPYLLRLLLHFRPGAI